MKKIWLLLTLVVFSYPTFSQPIDWTVVYSDYLTEAQKTNPDIKKLINLNIEKMGLANPKLIEIYLIALKTDPFTGLHRSKELLSLYKSEIKKFNMRILSEYEKISSLFLYKDLKKLKDILLENMIDFQGTSMSDEMDLPTITQETDDIVQKYYATKYKVFIETKVKTNSTSDIYRTLHNEILNNNLDLLDNFPLRLLFDKEFIQLSKSNSDLSSIYTFLLINHKNITQNVLTIESVRKIGKYFSIRPIDNSLLDINILFLDFTISGGIGFYVPTFEMNTDTYINVDHAKYNLKTNYATNHLSNVYSLINIKLNNLFIIDYIYFEKYFMQSKTFEKNSYPQNLVDITWDNYWHLYHEYSLINVRTKENITSFNIKNNYTIGIHLFNIGDYFGFELGYSSVSKSYTKTLNANYDLQRVRYYPGQPPHHQSYVQNLHFTNTILYSYTEEYPFVAMVINIPMSFAIFKLKTTASNQGLHFSILY